MTIAASTQKRPQQYTKHGLTTMETAMLRLGNRAIDGRSKVSKNLAKWRADLVQDLGGDVSTQQSAVIDLAVKSKLMLDSIDAWLLVQPSRVNARKKFLLPVVRERQTVRFHFRDPPDHNEGDQQIGAERSDEALRVNVYLKAR